MTSRVSIGDMASAINKQLEEYATLTTEGVKSAVSKAGNTVRSEIKANAPSRTGAYAKSWSVKKTAESSNSLQVTVHSRNRYQLAHLLEFGHAKRNGGRVAAQPHIAAAEEKGVTELEQEIERCIRNG